LNQFARTELLIGSEALKKLQGASVAVFGVGGVGSFAAEGLVRGGIGSIDIFDNDNVALSNLNRQLPALRSTVGMLKVEVMKQRLLDINPDLKINAYPVFFSKENAQTFDFTKYDYIVDAIDTVTSKLLLIEMATAAGVPIISSMGAGNKLDPTAFEVADIYQTSVDGLARVIRYECRKRGIERLKVVYSKETPLKPKGPAPVEAGSAIKKRQVPGSISFVPSVAGLIIAGEVIKDIIKEYLQP